MILQNQYHGLIKTEKPYSPNLDYSIIANFLDVGQFSEVCLFLCLISP